MIPPPDDATKDALFPISRPFRQTATPLFEVGLVLGGTVSAGAYTAGALDCLLEVLETWHQQDATHNISIPMVAGASGGAICAGLVGLVSRKQVPHIPTEYMRLCASDAPTGNPLWDIWVNLADGRKFFRTSDIGDAPLTSLLNAGVVDEIARDMAAFAQTADNFSRPYFPAPFRMAVTLTNLRGIPYVADVPECQGWSGAGYVAHDDFARFAVANGADPAAALDQGGKRPDEFWVDPRLTGRGSDFVDYQTLVSYAAASAAFPAGLRARLLERPAQHYAYRPYVRPKANGAVVELPQPDWQQILADGDCYAFASVDGGTFNNDPVRLVHQALAGMAGENPRHPHEANRALLMIDPLAARPRELPAVDTDLFSVVRLVMGAMIEGTRYLTADMALMADKNVFSRFQLVPARVDLGRIADAALTGGCFGAFGGFFCRTFRVHDFLLGRLNMRNYLRTTFILRADNSLFANWSFGDRKRWAVDVDGNRRAITAGTDGSAYFLPIIPDRSYGGEGPLSIKPDARLLPWPSKALDPESLREPIGERVDAVLTKLRRQELPGVGGWILGGLLEPGVASRITDQILTMFRNDLADRGLWPRAA